MSNTKLGWIIGGNLNVPIPPDTNQNTQCYFITNQDVQEQLKVFWELEECGPINQSIHECEKHFSDTIKRDETGRFIATMPLKSSPSTLGDSFETARKRLFTLERKLSSNHSLRDSYTNFIHEYEDLGHMTKVIESNPAETVYYIPHLGVLRENSTTTKLRVVFDASCKTTSNVSLNDIQEVGPVVQSDLFSILIRFRKHPFAISADIEKMYRQILITPEQRPLQRILWRNHPSEEIQIYQLNTVTYGTASAPFIATRCLKQLADLTRSEDPTTAKAIADDFYVDDLLTGAENLEQAIQLCTSISDTLLTAGFHIRKWASNCPEITQAMTYTESEVSSLNLSSDGNTKTLGVAWRWSKDEFVYSTNTFVTPIEVTKRTILSITSQMFDPLGLLSPIIIQAKIMIQQLWLEKVDWDDPLSTQLVSSWRQFYTYLSTIKEFHIPRFILSTNYVSIHIHGFSDASERAYGACVYIRSTTIDSIKVGLLCSKTKVAPLKILTIPKLELCAAALLVKLVNRVIQILELQLDKVMLWTDSQIVLAWIRTPPMSLKTFVRNRVSEIQQSQHNWNYVRSSQNPADLLSRGVQPQFLQSSDLWWHGPKWLSQPTEEWPISECSIPETDIPELKKSTASLIVTNKEPAELFTKFSKLSKLLKVVALCYRFYDKIKSKLNHQKIHTSKSFTATEIHNTLNKLLKIAQKDSFAEEIHLLKRNKQVKLKSNIASLAPFIDDVGFLRVGGRLQNSELDYQSQHQILLSGKHPLTKLIVEHEHEKLLHAGPQLLLSSIRDRFWIVNGRNLTRKIVHDCVRCFRADPKTYSQFMGNLPAPRVTRSFPFQFTGSDYAGPFLIRPSKGRGIKRIKCYICIFVCLTTKALHLEAVTDLTTESFLTTLGRFTSRRGKPSCIYSDNGTAYVGTNNELTKMYEFFDKNRNVLINNLALQNIRWKFIPASSPHFGGLWEAAVKSIKFHIKRVLVNTNITYGEFISALTGIEGILNSRPVSPLSSNPNDLEPLTPAHFLIGRKITTAIPCDLDSPIHGINFRYLQRLQNEFWTRWSKEYLSELQHRRKWLKTASIEKGTLVLVKEDNLRPFQWKLARIVDTHPGEDSVVRVVSIKTPTGVLKRSVSKLCPLPISVVE